MTRGTACAACTAPTNLTLCTDCVVALRIELTDVPALLADLDITRSRQDKLLAPYDHGPRGGEVPLPYKPHVGEVVWLLHNTLSTWTISLGITRTGPTTDYLARWLAQHLNRVRIHPDAGQLTDEVTYAIHQARHAIDRKDDQRLFLGPCGNEGCREELYGLPWLIVARCPQCGAEHDIAARQKWLHQVAQDYLGTAAEIAGFLRTTGIDCTFDMIRGYVRRGRLAAATDTHPPLFRIRDVILALENRYRHTRKAS